MISIDDKGEIKFAGEGGLLISQISGLLSEITIAITKNNGKEKNEILDKILQFVRLRWLLDTGMTFEEALDVLGMDPNFIIASKMGETKPLIEVEFEFQEAV